MSARILSDCEVKGVCVRERERRGGRGREGGKTRMHKIVCVDVAARDRTYCDLNTVVGEDEGGVSCCELYGGLQEKSESVSKEQGCGLHPDAKVAIQLDFVLLRTQGQLKRMRR